MRNISNVCKENSENFPCIPFAAGKRLCPPPPPAPPILGAVRVSEQRGDAASSRQQMAADRCLALPTPLQNGCATK